MSRPRSAACTLCCPARPDVAPSRSGSRHCLSGVSRVGLGLAWPCARVRDPPPGARDPAITVTCQRAEQAWPRRLLLTPARARRGWPPERRRWYGSARLACRPYGTAGCLVITGGVRFSRERPPRRCRAGALLAGRAHQLGPSVLTPPRSDRSGPVVRLPERGRIGEPRPAPGHVAPGGRGPDLVANDAMLSDRNRPSQRIEAGSRLQVFAVTVRPEAERPEPGYPASLAGHARSPGVPGKTT